MRHGVTDYLLKDNLIRLGAAVRRALEENRLRRERRALEEQFRQAQKLESVGQLAGGVAHDFSNILTVIQGYATLLEQGLIENEEAAREITFAVERAAGVSRQLLSLTRKQAMQPRLLDLNAVVGDMTKLLCRSLGDEISLHVESAADLPTIHADQGMLEQVLLNLALNARDAMAAGGRLIVTTRVTTIDPAEQTRYPDAAVGPAVGLRVTDTGAGISPENRARIFEPFFTTKALDKGTGLGLTTVQGIVQQHRGVIRLQSTVGEGTTFEIALPANHGGQEAATVESRVASIRGGHETILLVDDEPTLRAMMRMALKHFGYQVLEAASGKQALAVFAEAGGRVDLLLTDMVLPDGIGGRELAVQMRAKEPALCILYTSGFPLDAVSPGLAGQPGVIFLQKPFSMQKLSSAVRDCLQGPAVPET